MTDFTHMFAHQVKALARAVQTEGNPANAMVRQGIETRNRIVDALRTHGPMTAANIARTIEMTRAGTHGHLVRMAQERPPRVRRQSDAYNAMWEVA